jgi:ABC-2 type transport system ATP-binding protein
MTLAIEIHELRKTYPRRWASPPMEALKGISLSIAEGEVFGFVGPNGAGKSTAIKVLIGAMAPSAGFARLFGVDSILPDARRGLGFVPENPSLQEHLTPYEILLMGIRLHRAKVGDVRRHCLSWLERFDLAAVADVPLRGFSKGMLQRTALAHALALKPRLLILDEPLSGLDPIGRKDVVNILGEFRHGGGTLFFSSHVLHDVEAIADRFGLIHRGQLLTIRSPQELAADQADCYVLRYRASAPIAVIEDGKDSKEFAAGRTGLYEIEISAVDLVGSIAVVQANGGSIQDIRPKMSLETVFFKTIASSPDGHV